MHRRHAIFGKHHPPFALSPVQLRSSTKRVYSHALQGNPAVSLFAHDPTLPCPAHPHPRRGQSVGLSRSLPRSIPMTMARRQTSLMSACPKFHDRGHDKGAAGTCMGRERRRAVSTVSLFLRLLIARGLPGCKCHVTMAARVWGWCQCPKNFGRPLRFGLGGCPLSPCRLVSPLASRPLEPLICRRAKAILPCSLSGWSFLVSDCSLSSLEPCRPLSNLRFPGSSTVLAPVLETHALAWVCCR